MSIRLVLLLLVPALYARSECAIPEVFAKVNGLLHEHHYEEAAKTLDGVKHCALSQMERFESGWLYGQARHFATALDVFQTVPETVPDFVTHQYAIALSKFELADYRGASDVLKKLAANSKFDSKCANLLAVSESKLGLYQDASAVLAQDIHDHPEDLSAYLNLVTVCAEGGDLAKAAEIASDANRQFPQTPEVLLVRGAASTLLGRLEQAREDFSKAIEIAPREAEPRFFLALTGYKLAQYGEAAKVLQSAIDDGVVDPDLHYLMAECLLRLNPSDAHRVLDELNRAIQLNSNSVSARTLRGKLLLEAGQTKQATADLQLAIRLDATSRSATYNLARAYRAEGRAAEAKSLFDRIRSETGDTVTELGDKRLNQALRPNSSDNP